MLLFVILLFAIFPAGLALHNLPEGIALYIGTLANANVGYTLFIAIALHNVPAGAAVFLTWALL